MKSYNFSRTALTGMLVLGGCVASDQRASIIEQRLEAHLQETQSADARASTAATLSGSFEGVIKSAVEINKAFASARALEAAAMAQVGAAQAALRPQISGKASGGGLNEGSPVNNQVTGVAADLIVNQLVYDGGASIASIDAALAQALVARASAQEAGNSAAFESVRAWANLWAVQQQLGFLASQSAEVEVLLEQLDRMTESGMLDSSTRDSARVVVSDIQIEEAALRSTLTGAEARFRQYFGTLPSAVLTQPTALFTAAELTALSKDISMAPTLRKIAAELVAAESAERQASAQFKPTVNLNLGVASPMDKNAGTDTTLGLQVRYIFNDGGRRNSQLQAAISRREAASASLQNARAEAEAMAATSLAQLKALDISAGLLDKKLASAESQADTAAAQISLGQSTLRGVIEAQLGRYRAQEQQIKLISDRVMLQASIAASMGVLLKRLGVE